MVTDRQVRDLFRFLVDKKPLTRAARLTDMDDKTARKYRDLGKLPSEVEKPHDWATRANPFAGVWADVRALLNVNPGLQAKTIFIDLQRRHPGKFADGQLRTLQRHIKCWRATDGPAKEVFFAQVHEPGRLGASDFTSMNALSVTIGGRPFDHLVYHFVLTYSNWEAATVCFSESFESLSEGLQNALAKLGGVPARHRSDRMSLAVNNASDEKEFRPRYEALMAYYKMTPEKIQANHGNENGDVEQRHHRFKQAVDQELMMRGSRDFATRGEYEEFLRKLVDSLNANRSERLAEELAKLHALPDRRLEACKKMTAKVDSGSVIHIDRNRYSVPSRLIGESVEVRIYVEHLEVWYAQKLVERLPRLIGRDKHHVNYRHVIDWLVRKPGAFAMYRDRAAMYPSSVFRLAYDNLLMSKKTYADKEYLAILHLAAKGSEAEVESALRELLKREVAITVEAVETMLGKQSDGKCTYQQLLKEGQVDAVDLHSYDGLLTNKEITDEDGTDGHGEGTAGVAVARVAFAELPSELRGVGTASGNGDAELREVSAEPERSGMPGARPAEDRAPDAGVALAVGEELRDVRLEATADEGVAADAEPARGGGRFCGSQGEPAGVRETGIGEDAFAVCVGAGFGAAGSARVLQAVRVAGAGVVVGEARSEVEPAVEAIGELRSITYRRFGLCATEPRGDGGAVHAAGGSLRAGQCVADEQLAVLAVGADFQRRDDDGGGDRSAGASQRDRGAEPAELPVGTCEEGEGRGAGGGGVSMVAERWQGDKGAGGVAWLRSAGLRWRSVPLRYARPHRRGTALRTAIIVAASAAARDF